MSRQIYVNLPVADLEKSKAFFAALGFSSEPMFSDDTAVCIVLGENIFAMLLTHEKFASFSPNPIADTSKMNEVLTCLSCGSKLEVQGLVAKALAAGGSTYAEPQDHGFMYGHGFKDPDGHVWELMHMDLAAADEHFTAKAE